MKTFIKSFYRKCQNTEVKHVVLSNVNNVNSYVHTGVMVLSFEHKSLDLSCLTQLIPKFNGGYHTNYSCHLFLEDWRISAENILQLEKHHIWDIVQTTTESLEIYCHHNTRKNCINISAFQETQTLKFIGDCVIHSVIICR